VFSVANPVSVSLAQELDPRNASMMNGLMMGMAWGLANLMLMAVAVIAEDWGLERALQAVSVVGGLAGLSAALLPGHAGRPA